MREIPDEEEEAGRKRTRGLTSLVYVNGLPAGRVSHQRTLTKNRVQSTRDSVNV